MIRVSAMEQVGEYNTSLIAGEDPELALRLRRGGWRIESISADMMEHDLAMKRFGQWWQRTKRSGYADAHGAWLHGAGPERYRIKEVRRIQFWGGLFPLSLVALGAFTRGLGLLLLLCYVKPFLVAGKPGDERKDDGRMHTVVNV